MSQSWLFRGLNPFHDFLKSLEYGDANSYSSSSIPSFEYKNKRDSQSSIRRPELREEFKYAECIRLIIRVIVWGSTRSDHIGMNGKHAHG